MEKKPIYEARDDGTAVIGAAGLWLPAMLGAKQEDVMPIAEKITAMLREHQRERIAAGMDMRDVGSAVLLASLMYTLGTCAASIQNGARDKSEEAIMNATFEFADAITHDFVSMAQQMFNLRKAGGDLHLAQAAGQA